MKARAYDVVKTRDDVQSDFVERVIFRSTVGTVVECYREPEGYAVDLAIPDKHLVGGATYVNVVLGPEQFDVLEPALAVGPGRSRRHRRRPAASPRVRKRGTAPSRPNHRTGAKDR